MLEIEEQVDLRPSPFRISISQYYKMARLGFFAEKRVELINGRVFEIPPIGERHERCLGIAVRRLMKAFGDDYWVRPQMTIHLRRRSVPQPDLAVIFGTPEHTTRKPQSALLVIEVSQSTLRYDQAYKSRLYASNGITDYWILNLVENRLEVYRTPIEDRVKPFGYCYASIAKMALGETVSPLVRADIVIPVAELLPPTN